MPYSNSFRTIFLWLAYTRLYRRTIIYDTSLYHLPLSAIPKASLKTNTYRSKVLITMAPPKQTIETHISGQSNQPLSLPAHTLRWDLVVSELQTDTEDGLTTAEATRRLEQHGRNALGDGGGVSRIKILIRQVANAMTLVLILAMAVSSGIHSWIKGGVVAAVIAINVAVGFYQEMKTEKTMDSLRQLSSPTASRKLCRRMLLRLRLEGSIAPWLPELSNFHWPSDKTPSIANLLTAHYRHHPRRPPPNRSRQLRNRRSAAHGRILACPQIRRGRVRHFHRPR
jgi:hypothetical protein